MRWAKQAATVALAVVLTSAVAIPNAAARSQHRSHRRTAGPTVSSAVHTALVHRSKQVASATRASVFATTRERDRTRAQALRGVDILRRTALRRGTARVAPRRQAATGSISVTPTTGLASGTSLHVTGQGLTPGAFIFIVQCAYDNGTGIGDCDLATYSPILGQQDGTIDTQRLASRHLMLSGNSYDCAQSVNACNISWVDLGNSGVGGAIPIDFDPNAPAPISIQANPSTNLVHFQNVDVSGIGPAGFAVQIDECPTGTDPRTR